MAVLTLNSNGDISLENYNSEYSTESFSEAVKAVFKKIWEKILAIIGFIKKIFQKLFSRKNRKKEAIERLREDIRKVEEYVNENIKNGTEEENNGGETNSSNMNNNTRMEKIEIAKFSAFRKYKPEEIQNILKAISNTANKLEERRDQVIKLIFRFNQGFDFRYNESGNIDQLKMAINNEFERTFINLIHISESKDKNKYKILVEKIKENVNKLCENDENIIFKKDYSKNKKINMVENFLKYGLLSKKALKTMVPDYENRSEDEIKEIILNELNENNEDLEDIILDADGGTYLFSAATIMPLMNKLDKSLGVIGKEVDDLFNYTTSEEFLKKLNIITINFDKSRKDFKDIIDVGYRKLEKYEKGLKNFANFMKSFGIESMFNDLAIRINRIAKLYYTLDELYTKITIELDRILKEDFLSNNEGEATDGSVNT